MVLLAFAVTVACVSPWPDGSNAPRWLLLSIAVPCILAVPIHGGSAPPARQALVVLFMGATLLWSPDPWGGVDLWWHFALLAGATAIVTKSIESVFIACGAGLAVNSFVVALQLAGFEPVAHVDGQLYSGLFFNNALQNCLVVLVIVGLLHIGRWPLLVLAATISLPLFVPPVSRVTILAFVAVGVSQLGSWRRVLLVSTAAGLLIVAIIWLPGRAESNSLRLDLWMNILQQINLFGHGLGSLRFADPYMEYAHNDLLQIGYELGPIGAVGYAALLGYGIWYGEAERPVLIAFAVEGLVDFPLYWPATGFLAALCLGSVLNRRYRLHNLDRCRQHLGHAGALASRPF